MVYTKRCFTQKPCYAQKSWFTQKLFSSKACASAVYGKQDSSFRGGRRNTPKAVNYIRIHNMYIYKYTYNIIYIYTYNIYIYTHYIYYSFDGTMTHDLQRTRLHTLGPLPRIGWRSTRAPHFSNIFKSLQIFAALKFDEVCTAAICIVICMAVCIAICIIAMCTDVCWFCHASTPCKQKRTPLRVFDGLMHTEPIRA